MRLPEVLRAVRWSDGRLASHRHDRAAWLLRVLSLGLFASAVAVNWGTDSSLLVWAALVGAGVVVGLAASVRLRTVIRRIEDGGAGVPPRHPASSSSRLLEWFARQYDRSADKLEARADSAAARGDEAASAKYRRRATKERAGAARCRDTFV